jgi:hypothetical protein
VTFEEACRALGYDAPQQWMVPASRDLLIETAEEFSESGTKPIDPADAARIRAEIDQFA